MQRTFVRVFLGCVAVALAHDVEARSTPVPASSQTHTATRTRVSKRRLPLPGEFNVLVIVLDDLGTDYLDMYAEDPGPPTVCSSAQNDDVSTPRLDALRADGILFTRCYADPTCSPSRAAMLTGRYGRRTGMGHHISPGDSPGYELPLSEVCLPEILRDQSSFPYRRGAFGKWHMTDDSTDDCHPSDCGYEEFEGTKGNPSSHFEERHVTSLGDATGCTSTSSVDLPAVPGLAPSEDDWDAAITRADAANWINSLSSSERFYAYVAFAPPHEPWQVPPFVTLSSRMQGRLNFLGYEAGDRVREDRPADEKLLFRAMIEGLDYEIGQLLDAIPPSVLSQTVVIVIGDNGTPGEMIVDPDLLGHGKRTLYELGTHVPLIVSGALAGAHAGARCDALVGSVDLWRTVLNATGLTNEEIDAAMGGTTVDSVSFLHLIADPSLAGLRSTAYCEAFKNQTPVPPNNGYRKAVTDGSYRYMRIYYDDGSLEERLYHTASDPCEATDLLKAPHVLTAPESAALTALSAAMDAI